MHNISFYSGDSQGSPKRIRAEYRLGYPTLRSTPSQNFSTDYMSMMYMVNANTTGVELDSFWPDYTIGVRCGMHMFQYAAILGNIDLMRHMYERQPEIVDMAADNNNTALYYVITNSRADRDTCLPVVMTLLDMGADINLVNECNRTVLCSALRIGWVKMSQMFLNKGAIVGSKRQYEPKQPMTLNRKGMFTMRLIRHGAGSALNYLASVSRDNYTSNLQCLPIGVKELICTFICY